MTQENDILDHVLLNFSPLDPWTVRDAVEGTLVMGAPGSGKTANVGKNIAYSLLKTPHSGGLILTGKGEETLTWIRYCQECGRSNDLIVFNAESGHAFDPLFYLWNTGRGAGDLETIVEFFETLLGIGKQQVAVSTERFWDLSVASLIRSVLILLSLAGEAVSITNIHEVIETLPESPEQAEDPKWEASARSAHLLIKVRDRKETLSKVQWRDLDYASQYLFERWPNFDVKPRSSVEFTWVGMAHKFLFSPLREIFSDGRCTFLPEHTTHQGKWVLIDFPMLEFGIDTGKFINVLIKNVFQRSWLRRDLSQSANLLCLWQDEFQLFVTQKSMDNLFQQTCRSALVAVVCLTQNVLGLSEQLSEPEPGSRTKGFLGNLANKFFLQQNEGTSATFASDQIGKEYRFLENYNASSSKHEQQHASVGGGQQLVHKVESSELSRLIKPDGNNPWAEAIVYQGGKHFEATKTANCPDGRNYVRVAFSRDIKGAIQ